MIRTVGALLLALAGPIAAQRPASDSIPVFASIGEGTYGTLGPHSLNLPAGVPRETSSVPQFLARLRGCHD